MIIREEYIRVLCCVIIFVIFYVHPLQIIYMFCHIFAYKSTHTSFVFSLSFENAQVESVIVA